MRTLMRPFNSGIGATCCAADCDCCAADLFAILQENGDDLLTEAGDVLRQE